MIYIDTHAHLSDEQFSNDITDIIIRSKEAGVANILMPDVGIEGRDELLALCERYEGYLIPMVGVHPLTLNDRSVDWRREVDEVERLLTEMPKGYFCAVGEIGLDYHYTTEFKAEQREAFLALCELALQHDLPINIHTREAWSDMCDLLEGFKGRGLRGVSHAFCDTEESYRRISGCGDFLFSIGGVVTFKKSQVAAVVPHIPLSELVLETDAPYLTPAPHRGTRNDSTRLDLICRKIAEIKGLNVAAVAAATTTNARRIFSLKESL